MECENAHIIRRQTKKTCKTLAVVYCSRPYWCCLMQMHTSYITIYHHISDHVLLCMIIYYITYYYIWYLMQNTCKTLAVASVLHVSKTLTASVFLHVSVSVLLTCKTLAMYCMMYCSILLLCIWCKDMQDTWNTHVTCTTRDMQDTRVYLMQLHARHWLLCIAHHIHKSNVVPSTWSAYCIRPDHIIP